MPHYFFHLSFGQCVVPDEEGVELPNRSAARDEARAVVRDLVNPEIGGNSRRWASWFLEVADDKGRFFRTPIGHPALQIVTPDAMRLLQSARLIRCRREHIQIFDRPALEGYLRVLRRRPAQPR